MTPEGEGEAVGDGEGDAVGVGEGEGVAAFTTRLTGSDSTPRAFANSCTTPTAFPFANPLWSMEAIAESLERHVKMDRLISAALIQCSGRKLLLCSSDDSGRGRRDLNFRYDRIR